MMQYNTDIGDISAVVQAAIGYALAEEFHAQGK